MSKKFDEINLVVIGGGTGSVALLRSLKNQVGSITALVNMADDGGSTGVLRDELGVLPPGDVRQCLVALSDSERLRELFNYRFETGTLEGHSFGNLFLTALEKTTGNFADAIETASSILRITGSVVPATLDDVRLKMSWRDTSLELHGERVIDAEHFSLDPRQATLALVPQAQVNPAAITAIHNADLVVVAPGDLYTSLGPLLVIDGIGQALSQTNAKKIYVCNLVTKHGQTDGFSVEDHASEIERFAGRAFLDSVLYNNQQPAAHVAHDYEKEQAFIVTPDQRNVSYTLHASGLLGDMARTEQADVLPVTRSLIRHNQEALVDSIRTLYTSYYE